jgi:sugar lactone lactonase YvrE
MAIVTSKTLTTWPAGTFVENLAVLNDGNIVVSVLSEGRLDLVSPNGRRRTLAEFAVPPTGLVVVEGTLYCAVGEMGRGPYGPYQIWSVTLSDGAAHPALTINSAVFLNGLTRLVGHTLLAADSHLGRIYTIDLDRKTSAVWCEDSRLTPSPQADFLPGANGIKRFADHVYVSSNSRALLFRVPVQADGSAGELELIAERLRVDDFAFDATGNLYLATHIGNSLDRLTPSGERVSIAGVEQGMAGSTACAFGRTHTDRTSLYVTATGGIFGPPAGGLQPAKLVRLDAGVEGAEI